jgi:hypothetical protein
MKNALLVALVLVTAACGAYDFPGAAGTGTVTGQVTIFPCRPGPLQPAQPDFAPCKMMTASAAAGIEIIFTSGGRVTSTRTNAEGRYSVDLVAGTYNVSVMKYMRIISGPSTMTVKAGATVIADYVVDSGIRYAVPQK